jgi:hypothetical protein
MTRIDTLHRMHPECWVAVVEICHDEMLGRRLLIPVSSDVELPNAAYRYVVKIVESPRRVHLSFRYLPESQRVCHFDLVIEGDEVEYVGFRTRVFTTEKRAFEWLLETAA